jgi:hypothetical protein
MRKELLAKLIQKLLHFSPIDVSLLGGKPLTKGDADKLSQECQRLFFLGGHALCAIDYEFSGSSDNVIYGLFKRNIGEKSLNYKERHLRRHILDKNHEFVQAIEATIGLRYLNYVSLDGEVILYYQKELPNRDLKGKGDTVHRLIKAIDKYLRLFPESQCCKDFSIVVTALREGTYQKNLFDLVRSDDKILTKDAIWESRVRDRLSSDITKLRELSKQAKAP